MRRILWIKRYRELCHRIFAILGDAVERIEHIGATSICPNRLSPVVDVDVLLKFNQMPDIIHRMESSGFEYQGYCEKHKGHAFRPFIRRFLPFAVYCYPPDSAAFYEHIQLKGYLNRCLDASDAYHAARNELARQFIQNANSYKKERRYVIEIINEICAIEQQCKETQLRMRVRIGPGKSRRRKKLRRREKSVLSFPTNFPIIYETSYCSATPSREYYI